MIAAALIVRLWIAGCWLASGRLRELARDPTPARVDYLIPNDRVRLCGR